MEYPMCDQQLPSRPWREIALEVSKENDPERFTELVQELVDAMNKQRPCNGLRVVATLDQRFIPTAPPVQ
jgi:hypothetical protein